MTKLKDMTKVEQWKDIPGYEGVYQASNFGRIKRVLAKRGTCAGYIFSPTVDKKGYLRTRLTDQYGKASTVKVHRIICQTFHPNPFNLPQVNHKDTDKTNNNPDNLEWCDNNYNKAHAIASGIVPRANKGKFGADHNRSIFIKATHLVTKETIVLKGINEMARQLGTHPVAMWRVMAGEYKHTKNWYFERV